MLLYADLRMISKMIIVITVIYRWLFPPMNSLKDQKLNVPPVLSSEMQVYSV